MGTYVIRDAYERVQEIEQNRAEMKRHRQVIKQALHPGVTQKEAFTPNESRWLTIGVCREMACDVERGDRLAHRVLVGLTILLLLALGFGALQGRWAERPPVQTVEQVGE